ncbi:MAG: hypothetical protein SVX28_05375, partial [Pseudomonadota bacterium]|nr:hypothetical protein [Pseudomonadota bacterium]
LDLPAVMKAARAISQTIVLEDLLDNLIIHNTDMVPEGEYLIPLPPPASGAALGIKVKAVPGEPVIPQELLQTIRCEPFYPHHHGDGQWIVGPLKRQPGGICGQQEMGVLLAQTCVSLAVIGY